MENKHWWALMRVAKRQTDIAMTVSKQSPIAPWKLSKLFLLLGLQRVLSFGVLQFIQLNFKHLVWAKACSLQAQVIDVLTLWSHIYFAFACVHCQTLLASSQTVLENNWNVLPIGSAPETVVFMSMTSVMKVFHCMDLQAPLHVVASRTRADPNTRYSVYFNQM